MEKKIAKQLTWFMLTAVLLVPLVQAQNGSILRGDANGDGIVNIADVTAVIDHIHNVSLISAANFVNADANGDGSITIADVTTIVDIIHNKISQQVPTVTAPEAKTLTYSGLEQELVTAAATTGGALKYSLDGETWSSAIPTATAAGDYTVYYMVYGSAYWEDVDAQSVSVTISQRTVTVSNIIAQNKNYDGTATAELDCSQATFAGKVDGDVLTVTATGQFSDASVGTGKTVTISNLELGGSSVDNYQLAESGNQSETTANIVATAISPTVSLAGWIYGSPNNPSVSGNVGQGAETFYYKSSDSDAWSTTKPTNVGSYQVKALIAAAGGYNESETAPVDFTITQRTVTVSGIKVKDKTYDGTTTAELDYTDVSITTLVTGDNLTVTATGTFSDGTVGNSKVVYISDIAISGSDNYVLAGTGNQTMAEGKIIAASITPVVSLESWTYGSPNDPSLTGYTGNGTVTYSYKPSNSNTWSTTKPTDVGSYQVKASVAAAGNYAAGESAAVDFSILQKAVTVTGITVSNKTYDGTTTATFVYSNVSFEGIESGDNLTVTATGAFDEASAGADKNVTITGLTLGGTSVGNYQLATTGNQGNASATISPKAVTVSGITASNKTYDGNTTATLNYGSVTFGGRIGNDDLSVTATGAFADANVGSDKQVNIAGLTLGGDAAGNYVLAESGNQSSTTATITAASASVASDPAIVSDALTYTGSAQTLATAGTASGGTMMYYVSTSNTTQTGGSWSSSLPTATDAGTYYVWYYVAGDSNHSSTSFTPLGSKEIGKADASVTTAPTAVSGTLTYDGSAKTLFNTGSASGGTLKYKVTDSNTQPTSTSDFKTTIDQKTDAKTYYLWYYVDADDNHKSTAINTTAITKTIGKAAPTYTAPAKNTNLTYNGSDQALVTSGSTSHGSITYSTTQNGTYSTTVPTGKNAGTTYTVWYKLTGDDNHSDVAATQISNISIGKKTVTVASGITASDKVYNGNTSATLVTTGAVFTGIVSGDALTVSGTGTFADANVGTGKTVTISGLTLGGASENNYTLATSGNQSSTTANITAAATTMTAPVKSGTLTYNGNAQSLVTKGSASGGRMEYYVSTSSTSMTGGGWNTDETATNYGTYHVWYRVVADVNYTSNWVNGTYLGAVAINKADPTYTAPTVVSSWTYDGVERSLVSGGTVSGGTFKYLVTDYDDDNGTPSINDGWSTNVPKAKEPDGYEIWYYVEGDANHNTTSFMYLGYVSVNRISASLSYSTTSITKHASDGSFTNTLTNTGTGTVSYTSSNTNVATVNASTGAVTIVGLGTATIKATTSYSSSDGHYYYQTWTPKKNEASYTLTVEIDNTTANDVGKVLCSKGHIHNSVSAVTCGGVASGIIAYVGTAGSVDNEYSSHKGIAIALTDANNGDFCKYCVDNMSDKCFNREYTHDNAINDLYGMDNTYSLTGPPNSSHTSSYLVHPAAVYANNYNTQRPNGAGYWILPSAGQWNLIVKGLVGKAGGTPVNLSTSSDNANLKPSAFNSVISNAGGTPLGENNYWTSTQYGGAYYYNGHNGGLTCFDKQSSCAIVRAAFTF